VNGELRHEPVLADEVIRLLRPYPDGIYLDCTIGGGGHAEAILQKGGQGARLIGIDRDADALRRSRERLKPFGERVELHNDRFENMAGILAGRKMDGILMDLGVSSLILDDPSRGFSFDSDGPLDMRMDRSQPLTAGKIVNGYSEKELSRIFKKFGEERFASRIARAIAKRRAEKDITTTLELAELVKSAVPRGRFSRIHPATKVFMAIRIAVNGELENLEDAVNGAVDHLVPGGRLAVISFHSLEDRIVKSTFAALAKGCICPPGMPVCICGKKPAVKLLFKKPVKPEPGEIERNRRSRSAKLRAAERLAA
jgi:16S rRNA (cytosine1402-N4)-methyltransferase